MCRFIIHKGYGGRNEIFPLSLTVVKQIHLLRMRYTFQNLNLPSFGVLDANSDKNENGTKV